MSSFGRTLIASVGRSIRVSADGRPLVKAAGLTLDWGTVVAVSADITLPDGVVVYNGEKYLRYGQVVTMIGAAEVQTVEFTGGPTTGSAILTLPALGDAPAQSTAAISATATAAVFQAALQALGRIGPEGATVARAGAGTAGSPYVYTVTFARSLGDVPQLTATNTFGGGTTPTTTIATSSAGTPTGATGGKYGPYDPNASDGRQTLAHGRAFILNQTVKENDLHSDYPEAIYGGLCFRDRILQSEAATHTLALGPTLAEVLALFPQLQLVSESPS